MSFDSPTGQADLARRLVGRNEGVHASQQSDLLLFGSAVGSRTLGRQSEAVRNPEHHE